VRAFGAHTTRSKRQGIVPDILYPSRSGFQKPADCKTMSLTNTWYGPTSTRAGIRGKCIENRAAAVNTSYLRSARSLDEKFGGVAPGTDGPVLRKLIGYGKTEGFILRLLLLVEVLVEGAIEANIL
jgi:hypothetical protein